MAENIVEKRKNVREAIESEGSTHNWEHVTKQTGMFCYSGLKPDQVGENIKKM